MDNVKIEGNGVNQKELYLVGVNLSVRMEKNSGEGCYKLVENYDKRLQQIITNNGHTIDH